MQYPALGMHAFLVSLHICQLLHSALVVHPPSMHPNENKNTVAIAIKTIMLLMFYTPNCKS
jgi:hypothetical protein